MKKNKIILLIFLLIILLFSLIIFSTIFAITNSNSKLILSGISINNIDISNLTLEEAREKTITTLEKRLENNITLKYEEFETTISPAEIDYSFDITESIQKAYSIGKSGNIFQNNFSILNSMYNTQNFNVTTSYNEEKLNNIIEDLSVKIPGLAIEPSYYISDNSLVILKGSNGIELLKNDTKSAILSNFENLLLNENIDSSLSLITQNKKVSNINIESIYNEIHSEAQNASIQKNPFKLNPGSNGIDFAITLDEAKKMLSEDLEEYIIPLTYTKPEITINDLGDDIFPHTLSYFTTKYNESNEERVTNLKLSAEKINGTILLPGQTFSFNQTVGKRTIEAGYQESVIYVNGQAEIRSWWRCLSNIFHII